MGALANAKDLADWLGIDTQMGLYNFRPSVRPVPLEVHISGYPGKHYCPRMIAMSGLDRTGHMSFLTGQDWTPKFAGQVLPDRTESGLLYLKHFTCQATDISTYKISSLV